MYGFFEKNWNLNQEREGIFSSKIWLTFAASTHCLYRSLTDIVSAMLPITSPFSVSAWWQSYIAKANCNSSVFLLVMSQKLSNLTLRELLIQRSLRTSGSTVLIIVCICSSISLHFMLSVTEQSPVNSLYMDQNCAGDNLSSITNEVSFQTFVLCAREKYFGNSLSTDFMTLSLRVKWSGSVGFSFHKK